MLCSPRNKIYSGKLHYILSSFHYKSIKIWSMNISMGIRSKNQLHNFGCFIYTYISTEKISKFGLVTLTYIEHIGRRRCTFIKIYKFATQWRHSYLIWNVCFDIIQYKQTIFFIRDMQHSESADKLSKRWRLKSMTRSTLVSRYRNGSIIV